MDHYGEVGKALMNGNFDTADGEVVARSLMAVADELRAANLLAALNSTALGLNDYERVQVKDRIYEYLDIPG